MNKTVRIAKGRYEYINPQVWINVTPSNFVKKSSFYLTVLGMFECTEGYEMSRNYRPDYLILFTTAGNGTIEANGTKFKAEKNHICIIDCSKPHSYKADGKWDFWWMHINGTGTNHVYEQIMQFSPEGVKLSHSSEITALFNQLVKAVKNNYAMSTPWQSLMIHNILYLAISALQNNAVYKPYFNDVFEFIEENYMRQISIDDLANVAHKSRYYFMRQFKKITGETPYQHIINFRITQSKIMLESTDKSIAEIAKLCGFMDESNFINQFKKQEGVTPAEYRKGIV